jgi:hypothetical protein
MLSLVVSMIGSVRGLMNAPRSLIVSRMRKMSGRPGQQIQFADQWNIPRLQCAARGIVCWRSQPCWAWSRRRCSVVHSASSRLAVLAHAVAFIARP